MKRLFATCPSRAAAAGLSFLLVFGLWIGVAAAQDDDDTAAEELIQALVFVSDQSVATVDSNLFGINLVAGDIYGDDAGGLWSPQSLACGGGIVGCYQPFSYDLLRRIDPGLLRFPGGRLTRSYQWQGGIGPGAQRETLFGTDEFLYLTNRLGATPVITLSMYNPETGAFATSEVIEAAMAWVRYVQNESPYGPVLYWEVDSDTWENSDHPSAPDVTFKRVAPEAYAAAFLEMSAAIKAEFPDIQIGAVSYENEDVEDAGRLLAAFVDSGADSAYWPDFLTVSFFRPNFNADRCDLWDKDLDEELRRTMEAAFAAGRELDVRLNALLNKVDQQLGDDKPGVPVLLAGYNTQLLFAEKYTNYTGAGDPPDCPFHDLAHSLGAAIFNADVLMTTLKYSDQMLGAAMWNFMDYDSREPGYYGSAYLFGGEVVQRPNAMVLRMLSRDFAVDQVLATTTIASTFDNEQVGRTPAYASVSVAADERYIRVRVARNREPIENTPVCGIGNVHNPDPTSYIRGRFFVDEVSLTRDDVPPEYAVDLLKNGDFEQDLSVGWNRTADPAGAETTRQCDEDGCHLQVRFDTGANNNPDYQEQISQTAAVQPGGRYRVQFDYAAQNLQVKTQNLLCDPSWDLTSTPGPFNNAGNYWVEFTTTPAPARIIAQDCFDGANCVRVPIVGDPEFFHIRQRYVLQSTDPDDFHVVGAVKTDDLDAPVTIEAQARNASDDLVQAAGSFGVFDTTDWSPQDFRFTLANRAATAFINMHLRRKEGRKDNGVAYFDNVRMYREEMVYAPKIAIDICKDALCTQRRTIQSEGVVGNQWWTNVNLGGTPLVKALAGRAEDEINVLLINKDLDRFAQTILDLSDLDLAGERSIFVSRLTADAVDADNEVGALAPENQVPFDGGTYFGSLESPVLDLLLPPHSVTALKIIDPTLNEDDPDPNEDFDDDDDNGDDDTDTNGGGFGGGGDDDDGGGCGC
ncbi:MAG: hypothetical protein P9L99_12810 [Candidatus Lernaella stagnicola]|nr:hypothetical protein [Candidatus Lernaella stagnicola]